MCFLCFFFIKEHKKKCTNRTVVPTFIILLCIFNIYIILYVVIKKKGQYFEIRSSSREKPIFFLYIGIHTMNTL